LYAANLNAAEGGSGITARPDIKNSENGGDFI
jgi:hypothetical protein